MRVRHVVGRRHCGLWAVLAFTAACAAQPTTRLDIESHSVRIGDLNQHYRTIGEGPPLLLLHGLTNTWQIWRPHIAALATEHRLIIPDLRGHGDTPNPSSTLAPSQIAADMFALLDVLGVREVQLVGYSFGGHAALRMAASQPDRVEALIVVAGAHRLLGDAKQAHEAAAQTGIQPPEWWLTEVSTWHPGGESQIRQVYQIGVNACLAEDFDMPDAAVAAIRARTLLIQGDRDKYFPVEVPVDMYHRIPGAALWVLPNTTHAAVFGWEGIAPPDEDFSGSRVAQRVFPEVANGFLRR